MIYEKGRDGKREDRKTENGKNRDRIEKRKVGGGTIWSQMETIKLLTISEPLLLLKP